MKTLFTARTILRTFSDDDFTELKEMMTNANIMKQTGFKTSQTEREIVSYLNKWKNLYSPMGVWCVQEKSSQKCIGWFMLKETGHEHPELGYMINQDKWGKGFATEVAKTLLHYAFFSLRKKKVIASTERSNWRSVKVLNKIGMTKSKIQSNNKQIDYYELTNKQDGIFFKDLANY